MEGLGCEREQIDPLNMEADFPLTTEEDSDDPVEFLNEVRVPCLICGTDTEIDNIVKLEIDQFEEDTANNQDYQLYGGGGDNNHDVFHWFLKWFRVDIVKKGKQNKNFTDRGWDGEGGDILRFCGGCKLELRVILELQKQLDDLEERIRNGLGEVKGKMERFEGALESSGIYETDPRYKRVRSRIVKCVSQTPGHPRSGNQISSRQPVDDNPRSSRRSSRRPLASDPLNSAARTNNEDLLKIPIIVLSSLDTASADQHLIPDLPDDDDVKPDISLLSEPSEIPETETSPVIKITKTIRNKKKGKGNIRKLTKVKKKLEKKSVPKKTPKKSKASKVVILEDDWDTNLLEDDQSDPDLDEDKPSGRPQRKKRKANDEDFIPDDNLMRTTTTTSTGTPKAKATEYRRWNYKLDRSTNKITFGGITFSIAGHAPETVICDTCDRYHGYVTNGRNCLRSHMIKYHTNRFPCPHCPFRGAGRAELDTHVKSIHEGLKINRKFPCKICGMPIPRYTERHHEWTHMNRQEQEELVKNEPHRAPGWVKPKWQCEECGRIFKAQADLKTHTEKCHLGKVSQEKPKELCPE